MLSRLLKLWLWMRLIPSICSSDHTLSWDNVDRAPT